MFIDVFFKTISYGQLLSAMWKDENHMMFSVIYAVVDSENIDC